MTGKIEDGEAVVCATEGCGNAATERFESGGVGSVHCPDCIAKIAARALHPIRTASPAPHPGSEAHAGVVEAVSGDRSKLTFDLDRRDEYPGERHSKADRRLYNVIDWTGRHRGQIALTTGERQALNPLQPLSPSQPTAKDAEIERLTAGLKALIRAYVNLLESGRDRIVSLGGLCDLVDVMEARDPALIAAKAALSSMRVEGQPE